MAALIRIEIPVFDGFDELDAIGPYEVLRTASELNTDAGWDVAMVGAHGPGEVVAAHGLRLSLAEGLGRPDAVLVPGGGWTRRPPRGTWHEVQAGVLPARLAELAPSCRWVASVCTGAMLLAAAGLTTGRRVTTHHDDLDDLRASGARLVDGARVVDDGDLLTAAGVTAGLDLSLWITEREYGPAVADAVASEIEYQRVRDVHRTLGEDGPSRQRDDSRRASVQDGLGRVRAFRSSFEKQTKGDPSVSHHFDSAADRADGRINPCDLYAFPAASGTSALILTVNPDAGRSSPTTFRPDALYEFGVASDGGTSEDIALRATFTEPDDHGRQQVRILRADGPDARHGTGGTPLGEGATGDVFSLGGDGLAWAGLAADPFSGDGIAIGRFLQGLAEGRYAPEVFTDAPSNAFAGRDVTAIALQLPDAALGGTRIALWARISLHGDGPQRQVSRIGQAMLRPLFYNPPETEADLDALNAGAPATDRDAHGARVRRIAATAARLAGLPDPDAHAERVAAAFLPDGLTYRPGRPAAFHPGDGNGRALGDNAFDVAVAVLAGSTLANASRPRQATPAFPYLSAPQPADLPPLLDYFRSPQGADR